MNDRDEKLVRRQKLTQLREATEAYPNDFVRTDMAADLHLRFAESSKEDLQDQHQRCAVAGRVALRRTMGKASFLTLRDASGTIQCYLRQDELGDAMYQQFTHLGDLGDVVGVNGTLMKTNKGELTVQAEHFRMLAKSLLPLPEKFHGLEDQELKYRQRYVDLMVNEDSRIVFETRGTITKFLRNFFDRRGFLEVETPMMHPIPGGASARPFITHHNTLDIDLYLRIAPELYLKRLVVGGMERVYEINRNFRNEGLSTRHNPEFTMLEFYQAYSTYEDLIRLTAHLMHELVLEVCGSERVRYGSHTLTFDKEPQISTMAKIVATKLEFSDTDFIYDVNSLRDHANRVGIEGTSHKTWGVLLNELFEQLVEPSLIQPIFITEYPTDISPLARRNQDNPEVTDRFEYFVCGREIANGFSELNDPDDQAARFQAQVEQSAQGDAEAMLFDEEYITALSYGLPPTAGEGIGIDRLVMLLTDRPSIRDVLLFPQLRPNR